MNFNDRDFKAFIYNPAGRIMADFYPIKIVNVYSKTKFQAEKFTKLNKNHIIIRTNFTGFRKKKKKTFVDWIIECCLKKKRYILQQQEQEM